MPNAKVCMINFAISALSLILISPDRIEAQKLDGLKTVAESSEFTATSTSKEVEEYVQTCVDAAEHVTRYDWGKTVDGKTMVSAVIANPKYEMGKKDDRAVVFLLGNIHSGECAGKEGLLMLLRELAANPKHELLKNLVIIIAPNYNADGNDKMEKTNRPGQKGPTKGMGVRPNNMGLDLNRDFIKLESPEARNLIAYFNKVDPEVFIDCHTTNGSVHQYGLTYDIPHNPASPAPIRKYLRGKMMPAVTQAVEKNHGYLSFYYGNFNRDRTRWTTYGYQPRYSTEYFGMRGGLGILSEAYSYASYKDRIMVSRGFVLECMNFVSANHKEIKNMVSVERALFAKLAKEKPSNVNLPLAARVSAFDEKYKIAGYDGKDKKDYEVEFWGKYTPTNARSLPYAYTFPAKLESIAKQLERHGAKVVQATADMDVTAEVYTIAEVNQSRRSFQKHRMMSVSADVGVEKHLIRKGDFVVHTSQPLGRLVAYMLEPESADGLVTWNFLDDQVEKGKKHVIVRIPKSFELATEPFKSNSK